MGILDLYLEPHKQIQTEQAKSAQLESLRKGKSKLIRKLCDHLGSHYEKWIHKGRKEGIKDAFHYKEVCNRCGMKRW